MNTLDTKTLKFDDHLDANPLPNKLTTGSAHALMRDGCMVDVDPQSNMDLTESKVILYELCPNEEGTYVRRELNYYNTSTDPNEPGILPYIHSFGLTENYAIIPHQSFYFDYNLVMKQGKPLVNTIVDLPPENGFVVKIMPLDATNGEVIDFVIDQTEEPFYYFHFINSWEEENAIVMDISCLSFNMLPYFTLEMERNKTIRDSATFGNVLVKRYKMWIGGTNEGKWEVQNLSDATRSTDFPNYNKNYLGKPYCTFYALQWFYDLVTYADMAVTKFNTCSSAGSSSSTVSWHKENWFPSEATFVPNNNNNGENNDEDDGVLLFTALHGEMKQSFLVIVDAKTMQTIDEIPIPGDIVTFTTHGEWYSK